MEAASALTHTTQNTNLRFVKCLGAGGLGVCALFDSRQGGGGPGTDVQFYVVKTVKQGQLHPEYAAAVQDLVDERAIQRRFTGAMHTVQTYQWPRRQHASFRRNHLSLAQAVAAERHGALARTQNLVSARRAASDVVELVASRYGRRFAPYEPQFNPRQRGGPGHGTLVPPPPARQVHVAPAPPPQPLGAPFGANFVPFTYTINQNHVLFMEYLARGDLHDFIIKQDVLAGVMAEPHAQIPAQPRPQVPSRVLWNMWMCFLQMVVAMRRPVSDGRRLNTLGEFAPVEKEGNRGPESNFVHFDIDPGNILVGDFQYCGVQNAEVLNPNVNNNHDNLIPPNPT